MVNFRSKAAEIKAAGEAERGNFTPHGAPKRLYDYWLHNSKSNKAARVRLGIQKENFCHYWRVVGFWSPMLKVGKFLDRNFDRISAGIGVLFVIALLVALFTADDTLGILGIVLAAAALIFSVGAGFIGGVSLAMSENERERNDMPSLKWAIPLALIGLPTAIIGFGITKGVQFYENHLTEHKVPLVLGTLAIVVVGVFVIIAVEAGIGTMLVTLASTLAAIALGALIVFGFIKLGQHTENKRAYARTHPKPRPEVEKEPREPGKIALFFRAVGDFLVLLAQAVRVNKWKICPLVEIDTAPSGRFEDNDEEYAY